LSVERDDDLAGGAALRQEMMQRVSDRIGQEAAGDPQRYRRHGANALLVDARAVPVIGLGILLTSIPDLVARSTLWSCLPSLLRWSAWSGRRLTFWAFGPAGAAS